MPFDNLAEFLSVIHEDRELHRVPVEVDSRLEVSAITNTIYRQPGGGPALQFDHVHGSRYPLVVNLLGSQRRLCRALGVRSLTELQETMQPLLKPQPHEGWLQTLKQLSLPAGAVPWQPQLVKTAPCQQVVKVGRDVDLLELPSLHCWPQESSPLLLGGQILTRHPDSGQWALETCPLEVRDRSSLGVHWSPQQQAWQSFQIYRRKSLPMPMVISFGGDPLLSLLTTVPPPPSLDPISFAGFLRGRSLDLVRCRQIDAEVPAMVELVIEGHLDPGEPEVGGTIVGLRHGHYSTPGSAAVFRVAAVTHRGSPMLTAIIPGSPPSEHTWRDLAAMQLTLPMLKARLPELVNVHLPLAGAGSHFCFASIRKSRPGQASRVMHALWSEPFTMYAKYLIVVDDDVDLYDEDQVWGAIGAQVHPGRDLQFVDGATSALDHATPTPGIGKKIGIDATRKWREEGHPRDWPDRMTFPSDILEMVNRRWGDYQLPSR